MTPQTEAHLICIAETIEQQCRSLKAAILATRGQQTNTGPVAAPPAKDDPYANEAEEAVIKEIVESGFRKVMGFETDPIRPEPIPAEG